MARMRHTTIEELERVLHEPLPAVMERERHALDRLLEDSDRNVVLFGAGGLGKQTLACLRSIGIEPRTVSDNDPARWGTQLDGANVVAPEAAARAFGADALFIVTIWNPYHWYSETRRQLAGLGCRRIAPPSPVYWRFADTFLPFYAQDLPHKVSHQADAVLKAAAIWSDDRSSQEYLRQVSWRMCGSWTFDRSRDDESYFPDGMFELIPDEVFIDCGAFDGDTLRAYLSRAQRGFRRFVAIEPDETTFARLSAFVAGLSPEMQCKISVQHCAVGAERTMIPFQATGELSSKSAQGGTSLIRCVPISELADPSVPVTFIKMDIEGAEYDALKGARPTIERDRPVLAVCVYHNQHDLWQLPLFMKAMVPDYRMYLRCHEGDGWQTVAYAVPPERAHNGRDS
jgi:FkbM family methyltransferase